jgi:hypothetical protein
VHGQRLDQGRHQDGRVQTALAVASLAWFAFVAHAREGASSGADGFT